jgi:hypothetical protein
MTEEKTALAAAEPQPAPGLALEEGKEKQPVFQVGPIACDDNHAIGVAVWAWRNTGAEAWSGPVHAVTIQSRQRQAGGPWKDSPSFRGLQLPILIYCLQKAHDWILRQRDPQNTGLFRRAP